MQYNTCNTRSVSIFLMFCFVPLIFFNIPRTSLFSFEEKMIILFCFLHIFLFFLLILEVVFIFVDVVILEVHHIILVLIFSVSPFHMPFLTAKLLRIFLKLYHCMFSCCCCCFHSFSCYLFILFISLVVSLKQRTKNPSNKKTVTMHKMAY